MIDNTIIRGPSDMPSFTMVPNGILEDETISTTAVGLYARIIKYSKIPNFNLKSTYLQRKSNLSNYKYKMIMRELKNHGYLELHIYSKGNSNWLTIYQTNWEPRSDGVHTIYHTRYGCKTNLDYDQTKQSKTPDVMADDDMSFGPFV